MHLEVVVYDGEILEKPLNAEEARRFIRGYGELPAQTGKFLEQSLVFS